MRARANQPLTAPLRVQLITKDGATYEATMAPMGEVQQALADLHAAPLLLTPRPYPGFLPLTFELTRPAALRLADVEVLQVVLNRLATPLTEPLHVDIEAVELR